MFIDVFFSPGDSANIDDDCNNDDDDDDDYHDGGN